jgi:putative membrane protein
MTKVKTLALALAGLALFTGVFIALGAGHVIAAILKIGWLGLAYVLLWQFAVYILLGVAWRILLPGTFLPSVIWGRLVREGSETCLPFSEVGGLIFGARALMLGGISLARAGASSIADIITEGIALAPFLVFGLLVLLAHRPHASLVLAMCAGLAALLAAGAATILLRRHLSTWLRGAAEKLLATWAKDAPDQASDLQHELESLLTRRGRLAAASALHLLCWFGGGGNVWIAYHLLGAHPSILNALAIEAILSGVLAIGFLIPAGLGVQELTYVGIGHLFGLPAHISLALSLVRRTRDILIGAPALVAWQAREARGLVK